MKIAVLGAGFIGLPLISACLEKGYTVNVLDRNPCKTPNHEHLNWSTGEFHNSDKIVEVIRNVDVVFHLLSSTVPGDQVNLQDELIANVSQTLTLLDLCVEHGVKKIVFMSSSSVYGNQLKLPISETALPKPLSTHGISKISIEYYLHLYKKQRQLSCHILRLSNPYGPGQPIDGRQGIIGIIIGKLKKQQPVIITGDGSMVRDFIYIDDVIENCMKLIHYSDKHVVFNLGSSQGTKIIDLINMIKSLVGSEIVIQYENGRKSDIQESILDISKLKEQMGFEQKIDLYEGLRRTLEYHNLV